MSEMHAIVETRSEVMQQIEMATVANQQWKKFGDDADLGKSDRIWVS